jgi:hypothetical protein
MYFYDLLGMLSSNQIFNVTNLKYLLFNNSLQRKIKKMNAKPHKLYK